jgi:hypothetical protein
LHKFTDSLPAMSHLIPDFYATLHRLKAVENARRSAAMKDFVKATLVLGAMLALVLSARVAAFAYLHSETAAVTRPAPIAAANGGCGETAVKFPCLRQAAPEGRATASAPRQSGSAESQTIAAPDTRCAVRQVKMPCFQHTGLRS